MEIDQSCLEERQREHVARMRVERIIELIAAALPELEMRAVAPATEVWAKVDLVEQTIRLRRGSRYAVVVHLPPRLIHFLVELARFKLNCFEPLLDVTDCIILRVQALSRNRRRRTHYPQPSRRRPDFGGGHGTNHGTGLRGGYEGCRLNPSATGGG